MMSSSRPSTVAGDEEVPTPVPSLTYLRPQVSKLHCRLVTFINECVIPAEHEYHQHMSNQVDRWSIDAIPPCLPKLQQQAQHLGLWNLFIPPRLANHLPQSYLDWYQSISNNSNNNNSNNNNNGQHIFLTYREYGILAEQMGRSELGAMACNCSAPDTGNMEVLLEFGTHEQQLTYLVPLLKGEIRSTFLMTEPNVASSDPTNLSTTLTKCYDNNNNKNNKGHNNGHGHNVSYILNGRKWWSTGAMDPRCRVGICVARIVDNMDIHNNPSSTHVRNNNTRSSNSNNNKHGQHTIVIVPIPSQGFQTIRPLTVFGYDDAPFGHAEVALDNIQLTHHHLVGGEGSGFQVSQARLGPGRIHHCMRAVGMAQRCYDLMLQRSTERKTFGKFLWEHGSLQRDIANSFADLHQARLLTLHCAHMMDTAVGGPKQARQFISSIKVAVPKLCMDVIDRALQVFGGAGVSDDYVIANAWASMRTLRIADGPDEVHRRSVALKEIKQLQKQQQQQQQQHGQQKSEHSDLRPYTSRL